MALSQHPLVYEINTWVWLDTLSRKYGRPITLLNVPAEALDALASWSLDAVWLMGVWERSPRGREIALRHPGLQTEYGRALPGYQPEDVIGSPYAVRRYVVDERLGGPEGLARLREHLSRRGLALILDYVPNHVAIDHPWTLEQPECLVQGTDDDLRRSPGAYFSVSLTDGERRIFAHGRDPYFPAWTDTAQVDAFSPEARQRSRETLLDIAAQCDGVRCDMAMLVTNRIFAQTWSRLSVSDAEFWSEIIPEVKTQVPGFIFAAEVYWDMEWELQQLGFDYTYDKRLYDRLVRDSGRSIRDHLMAPIEYQERLVRFVENHDEARALSTFGPRKVIPAAVLAATLPGMRLFHDGQFEGRRVKLPVQLGTAPEETLAADTVAFYRRLLAEVSQPPYHQGAYMMLGMHPPPAAADANPLHENLITFAWALEPDWRIVIVNYADIHVQGRLMLPRPAFESAPAWRFEDALNPRRAVTVEGDHLLAEGLSLKMEPYDVIIYRVSAV
jgi:hypothetical protein